MVDERFPRARPGSGNALITHPDYDHPTDADMQDHINHPAPLTSEQRIDMLERRVAALESLLTPGTLRKAQEGV